MNPRLDQRSTDQQAVKKLAVEKLLREPSKFIEAAELVERNVLQPNMSFLHSLLAELGLKHPYGQSGPSLPDAAAWQDGRAFTPVEGHRYEIVWQGDSGPIRNTIRVDGLHPDLWFDLDRGEPLSSDLAVLSIKAFRDLDAAH